MTDEERDEWIFERACIMWVENGWDFDKAYQAAGEAFERMPASGPETRQERVEP